MHEIQDTTEHVVNHHEPVAAVIVSSDVESDDDLNIDDINDSEIEIDNVGDLNNGNTIESLATDFQRMYINDSVDISENDTGRVNYNSLQLSRWQKILCKFSSNIMLREHKIISKENETSLHEARSRLIECVICMNNICSIIIFPCKHFVMCKSCFDTHTGNLDICHFCPLCRTIIQSNSHVFLA